MRYIKTFLPFGCLQKGLRYIFLERSIRVRTNEAWICQDSVNQKAILLAPVGFPAMRHAQNLDQHLLVVDDVDDSVISYPDAVLIAT